jgi:DNA polymerase-3 subunit alpha
MLSVLEQAQGAGQKAQQDALIGQGSIFDLGFDGAAQAAGPPSLTPSHAPIPTFEFDRAELLAAEKESLGLFVSAHPLKDVRVALAARVDCSLVELSDRRDGEWVTIGGMLAQAKRIRTKKGDPMMFATLDDLEGAVELVIFGKALAASEDAAADDTIVLVRGRVDHKDRDKTCVIVQQLERFEPTPDEVQQAAQQAAKRAVAPAALRLRLDARGLPPSALIELKELLAGFPGDSEVVIELSTSVGARRLRLGSDFRVARGAALHAELEALLGAAILGDDTRAQVGDSADPAFMDEPDPVAASA